MRKSIAGSVLLATVICLSAVRLDRRIHAGADQPDESLVVVTHVDVTPKFTASGNDLLREFAGATRKDEGCVRVEVFEEVGRPNHSTVIEVWKTQKVYEDHLGADHVRAYRGKLQPMLGSPFDERLHKAVR